MVNGIVQKKCDKHIFTKQQNISVRGEINEQSNYFITTGKENVHVRELEAMRDIFKKEAG